MTDCCAQGKGASVDDWLKLLADVRSAGKDCVLGYGTTEVMCSAESRYHTGTQVAQMDTPPRGYVHRCLRE